MSYINYDFPHSRNQDSDLSQIVEMYQNLKNLPNDINEFKEEAKNTWFDFLSKFAINALRTVKDYGAKGDGTTDDTEAIKKCIENESTIYFPKGRYIVSEKLVIINKFVVGEGSGETFIIGNHRGVIFDLNRTSGIVGVQLSYNHEPSNSDIAITLGTDTGMGLQRGGFIRNVILQNVGIGISDEGIGCFSAEFSNLEIINFTSTGIKLTGISTGNVLSNIYITQSNFAKSCDYGVFISGWNSTMLLEQINVEWGKYATPVYLENIAGLCAISIHLEEIALKDQYSGYIVLSSVSGYIGSLSAYYTNDNVNGTSVIELREAKSSHYDSNAIVSDESRIEINTLTLVGLRGGEGIADKGLTNLNDFAVVYRKREYADRNYYFRLNNYLWSTYPGYNDEDIYKSLPTASFDNVFWEKLGQTKFFGTSAELPEKRLCNYATSFYNTDDGYLYLKAYGDVWRKIALEDIV